MTLGNLNITDAIYFQEGQASKLWRISEQMGALPWGRNMKVQNWTQGGSIKLMKEKASILETVAKVVMMATVVIPLCALIFKAYFRTPYKFEVIDPKSIPTVENTRKEKTLLTKEVIWPEALQSKFIERIAPLLEDIAGKKFLVMNCVSDRFEEFLDMDQRMKLATCDALVVLRWGNNVAPGTTASIDAGMSKRPVIQIQYDDNQAKIISSCT